MVAGIVIIPSDDADDMIGRISAVWKQVCAVIILKCRVIENRRGNSAVFQDQMFHVDAV